MNFSEKLIELRKKEGLSQEELGHKLNVTRQTISKWELGQTTPEMDKLIEMSKIFNVTVDELTRTAELSNNSNPVVEEKPVDDMKKKRIIIICVVIAVVALLFVVVLRLPKINIAENLFGIFNKQQEMANDIVDTAQGVLGSIQNQLDDQLNSSNNISNDLKNYFLGVYSEIQQGKEYTKNQMEEEVNDFEIKKFNSSFELYQGTQFGNSLRILLDTIITNNKTQDKKITLKLLNQKLTDADEIKVAKQKIETFTTYEVSFEYNKDGYIFEANVEKIK